jgi:hypothetical protein
MKNRFRGFAAGMASGITKLVVGHPFGKLVVWLLRIIVYYW